MQDLDSVLYHQLHSDPARVRRPMLLPVIEVGITTLYLDHAETIAAGRILLTPTADATQASTYAGNDKLLLTEHAEQIRQLASQNSVALADSLAAYQQYTTTDDLTDLLSWSNHPNRTGHELVARELLRWFPAA